MTISSKYCKPDSISLLEIVYLGFHHSDYASVELHTTQTSHFVNRLAEEAILSGIFNQLVLYLFLTVAIEGNGNHDVGKSRTGTKLDEV